MLLAFATWYTVSFMWQSYIQEKEILLNPWFENGHFPLVLFQNSKPKDPLRHEYIFYCFSGKLFFEEFC